MYHKTIISHIQQLVQFIREKYKKTVSVETETYFISPQGVVSSKTELRSFIGSFGEAVFWIFFIIFFQGVIQFSHPMEMGIHVKVNRDIS